MKAKDERELLESIAVCEAVRTLEAKRKMLGQSPTRPPGVRQVVYLTPWAVRYREGTGIGMALLYWRSS